MSAVSAFRRLLPLGNRVLIKPFKPETKTKGGIILKTEEDKSAYGTVIACGPGAHGPDGKLIPMSVKDGDTVLLPEFGGTKVKLADAEYSLFRDNEILGVMHK